MYLAIQLSVGREVALKVLSPELRADPSFGDKFFREANIVGALSHHNIVSIYDVGTQDEHYYIAMDYLPGAACSEKIKSHTLSLANCLNIVKDIASALDYAHERGFVHCDVKPDNILFRHDGSAVLTDFGIATASSAAAKGPATNAVAGTPNYMSPEQTQGKSIDGRSDIYSLGILFYEMLSNEVPFKGKDAVAVAVKHLTAATPKLPEEYRVFQPILNKMLAKKPGARFQRGKEIVDAIQAIEGGLSKDNGIASTEPTALQAYSLLEALMATFGHVSITVLKRLIGRLEVLRRLRLSRQHGLVLKDKPEIESQDIDLALSTTQLEDDTTHLNTRTFGQNLDEALAQNRAKLLASPLIIGSAILVICATVLLFSFNQQWAVDKTNPLATLPFFSETNNTQQSITQRIDNQKNTAKDGSITDIIAKQNGGAGEPTGKTVQNNDSAKRAKQVVSLQANTKNSTSGNDSDKKASKPSSHQLTVKATPGSARIRILNIKPRYKKGMLLEPGKYHLSVSANYHQTQRHWITIEDKDLTFTVKLKKAYRPGDVLKHKMKDGTPLPAMVVVPKGQFTMGDKQNGDTTVKPAHKVKINKAWAISAYEITYAEYDVFAKATNREQPPDYDKNRKKHPVSNISWSDAFAYAAWLSDKTGNAYRLPTEAEWEYAARAKTTSNYWWKGDSVANMANCKGACKSSWVKLFSSSSAPVGSYKKNPFGLYDTSGNLAEWVQDCYKPNYQDAPKNGSAVDASLCPHHVIRGGSFKSKKDEITNIHRDYAKPNSKKKTIGLRIVLDLD